MKTLEGLKNVKIFKNPFFLFSPFLLLSVIIVVFFDDPCLVGDENKYLDFTQNLLNGYFSLPAPDLYLGVGPGYPLILLPFIALKLPLICITLFNSVLYYLSIVILYKSLQHTSENRIALIGSIFWAFYYNLYENFSLILPEIFSPFLVTLLLYFLVKAFNSEKHVLNKFIFLAGFTIGFLALTKIIFGYILLVMISGSGLLWLFDRKCPQFRKTLFILLLGLTTTLPYLIHTYQLTGRLFYWGTTAGNNMYWMSTPYEREYGSWFPDPHIHRQDSINRIESSTEFRNEEYIAMITGHQCVPGTEDYIWKNHHEDFKKINKYTGIEQDDAFKKMAIQNIKAHPFKYVINLFSNMGRILFNYPYSYKYQNPGTLLRFPPNGVLALLALFCLFPTIINWRKLLFPLRFLIFLVFIYLGGSLTGSAETRMFTVIVPVLIFWITYMLQKTVKINWKF